MYYCVDGGPLVKQLRRKGYPHKICLIIINNNNNNNDNNNNSNDDNNNSNNNIKNINDNNDNNNNNIKRNINDNNKNKKNNKNDNNSDEESACCLRLFVRVWQLACVVLALGHVAFIITIIIIRIIIKIMIIKLTHTITQKAIFLICSLKLLNQQQLFTFASFSLLLLFLKSFDLSSYKRWTIGIKCQWFYFH